jgi:hypothetical protein
MLAYRGGASVLAVALVGLSTTPPVSAAAAAAPAAATARLRSLDGLLMVAHGTRRSGAMVMQTLLVTDTGSIPLAVPMSLHRRLVELAGPRVNARGTTSGRSFAVTTLSTATGARVAHVAAASPRANTRTPKVMRIAVVLMRFPGSNAGATKAAVKAPTFGARKSVANWFSQTSGKQVKVTGTVFGYYPGVRTCDLGSQMVAGAVAAAKDGYVASKFDHLVVVEPAQDCGFGGIGWVGQNGVFLNGDVTPGVMEHELGHNLGLWHAGAYACGSNAIATSCLAEYGDPSDVMGSPYLNHGYNAEHKHRIGWIPAVEVRTVSTGTQTITLTASEDPLVAGSIQLIHLRAADGTMYSIDKRASIGYDAGLSGVWIRRVAAANTVDTALVRSSAYTPGSTFTDLIHHVTVKTLTDGLSKATVRVCVGVCKAE